MLTSAGVEARLPEEAGRRRWLGKFYYRPPGGESWADVVLRLRSLLADLDAGIPAQGVLLVCHDAVILLIRYILEGLRSSSSWTSRPRPPSSMPRSAASSGPTAGARGCWRASTWPTTS